MAKQLSVTTNPIVLFGFYRYSVFGASYFYIYIYIYNTISFADVGSFGCRMAES